MSWWVLARGKGRSGRGLVPWPQLCFGVAFGASLLASTSLARYVGVDATSARSRASRDASETRDLSLATRLSAQENCERQAPAAILYNYTSGAAIFFPNALHLSRAFSLKYLSSLSVSKQASFCTLYPISSSVFLRLDSSVMAPSYP